MELAPARPDKVDHVPRAQTARLPGDQLDSLAPRCPSESAAVACSRGLEGLTGTAWRPWPSLVMMGATIRASALDSRVLLPDRWAPFRSAVIRLVWSTQ